MTAPSPSSVPRVGAGFRLQWEPAQECHVLLYPEGMVKLNGSAGEIMKRCDGERSVAAIVADLEQAFAAQGLEGDVLAFVEMAGKQRWLLWE
jgi:pyrroloquinoline quinone biosynthesis protein D